MVESMTGFGGGRARHGENSVEVSLRSVNNRSFKLTVRMPDILSKTQQDVEKRIKDAISRGTIYCLVEVNGPLSASYSLDESAVLSYCRSLAKLAKKAGVSDQMSIDRIAALPGVVREDTSSTSVFEKLVEEAAQKAVKALLKSRRAEGKRIESELKAHLENMSELHGKIQKLRSKSLKAYAGKLKVRTEELIQKSNAKIGKDEITREVAIVAERSDIAEEIQRLGIHIKQMKKTLSSGKPAGRELEFISQEMLREANTMSAKSLSSELVVPLLELKSNIDRIREQAQNVQ